MVRHATKRRRWFAILTRKFSKIIASLVVFALASFAWAKPYQPCPPITIESPDELNLSKAETKMICGDAGNPTWESIPLTQAAFFLRGFLQARGYQRPEIDMGTGALHVKVGKLTLVQGIRIVGAPHDLKPERYWEPNGRPLTPDRLNDIEKWVKRKLAESGFPCAHVKSEGNAVTGIVTVNVASGPPWSIREIQEDPIPGMIGGIPRRYDPFELGDSYDARLLELSAQRLMTQDIVLNASFTTLCENPEPGIVRENLLPGEPRMISFGFGFDTEQLFIGQALWKNSRFSTTASLLRAEAMASYRRQKISGQFDWYYLPFPSRHYLNNVVMLEREFEDVFESRNFLLRSAPAWNVRLPKGSLELVAGPSYRQYVTIRGGGPGLTQMTALDLDINYISHDFEYYSVSPRDGLSTTLSVTSADKGAASDISATRALLGFTKLWNIWELDPPVLVLGLRGEYATTIPRDTPVEDLPASFRNFLGGSSSLRGFGRRALPRDPRGALTRAHIGAEVRINHALPAKFQPFVFADAGKLGAVSRQLDPTLYWSPGLGLRWESPIGTMRATAAHGLIEGKERENLRHLMRWQFYFSLGEQF